MARPTGPGLSKCPRPCVLMSAGQAACSIRDGAIVTTRLPEQGRENRAFPRDACARGRTCPGAITLQEPSLNANGMAEPTGFPMTREGEVLTSQLQIRRPCQSSAARWPRSCMLRARKGFGDSPSSASHVSLGRGAAYRSVMPRGKRLSRVAAYPERALLI